MYRRHISKKAYVTCLISIIVLFFLSAWDMKDSPTFYSDHLKKIIIQTMYLDGEYSEEILFKEADSQAIISEYKDYTLLSQSDKEFVFQKYSDDISPLLKANGYFGITEEGALSIFNGKPTEADVIQSFFHINVEMLEAKAHHELVEGIRVKEENGAIWELHFFFVPKL